MEKELEKMLDKIEIKNIFCYTQIGFGDSERHIGQRLIFDVKVFLDLSLAGKTDCLNDTVSYVEISKKIIETAKKQEYKLLEHLGESICEALFEKFQNIKLVKLNIKKPHIPDCDFIGDASIYLFRYKKTN